MVKLLNTKSKPFFYIVFALMVSFMLYISFSYFQDMKHHKAEFDSSLKVRVPDVNKSLPAGGHKW